ncbi:hypothetical protein CCM_01900 [Cordyceps militaris CM01]|uniref:Kinase-like domain n=1 Tax=Cordyceps militaris (strain CM01) TaxID=983644 RepID=G3J2W1_CORMM|nr:uncharacterized protein CCM_01900 [Cordyceps militaris CM01]EGX97240.1 hypothetical protein CCM_01900 [Cordyceps militaris CM01]
MPNRLKAAALEKPRLKMLSVPFLDETLMAGPPSCKLADFATPRLRRCTFDQEDVQFENRLDGGLDGYVWKVTLGNERRGPFALKMFWDNEPPKFERYYAAQRECQNAAIFQMMEAAVSTSNVRVLDMPRDRCEAEQNYYAFSDELRDENPDADTEDTRLISSIPRMVRCYGWMKISGSTVPEELRAPPLTVGKIQRLMPSDENYIAVIYEFVEDGDNEPCAVDEVLDFLWHGGFCSALSPLGKNWKSGVLIDLSDIIHVFGFAWNKALYGCRSAAQILVS